MCVYLSIKMMNHGRFVFQLPLSLDCVTSNLLSVSTKSTLIYFLSKFPVAGMLGYS